MTCDLPSGQFFRYLKTRKFVRQVFPRFDMMPEQRVSSNIMTKAPNSKHMISLFADLFSLATLSLHIKQVWIKDTDEVISDELCVKRLERIKASSINTTLQSFPRLN